MPAFKATPIIEPELGSKIGFMILIVRIYKRLVLRVINDLVIVEYQFIKKQVV